VPPGRFIPLAEQTGLIVAIGSWVLRLDLSAWRDSGLDVPPVSVNLSPLQFRDPDLLRVVHDTLRETGTTPEQICMELTEGAVMDDVPRSEQVMRNLKAMGVRLSLDDFGTGYSSLSYLQRFPFDKVKIDQSFVREIHSSSQDAVIAKVVISMAHGLGLRVIAEGVETEMQCEFMRRNVCDEIQGYFFSRPVPEAQMRALLAEDRRLPAHLVRDPPRSRTLLLVDDEPNVIAALRRLLRPDGYRILHANSGAEGLALLADNPVDIIVSDQRMPGMTGVEFLRRAKVLYPQTIRIVLSGHTELQSVTDAVNEGAVYRFLTKPWDDAQLRGFLDQAFQHKEMGDENEQLTIRIRTANQELAASNRQMKEGLDKNQQALAREQREREMLRDALMHIPVPVLVLDDTGAAGFANTLAEELLARAHPLAAPELDAIVPGLGAMVLAARHGSGRLSMSDGRSIAVDWNTASAGGRVATLREVEQGETT
jgi:EAL domain-containing protein (putative c-di-GMP-specific phosphodiesterase class I)/CheY-like chemotaxis protein